MDSKLKKHAVLKEGAIRARTLNRLLGEVGFKRLEGARAEWRRELGDHLISLQATAEGTWWLTMVCGKDDPSMEFSGNLGQCLMQYAGVVNAIQAGIFGGKK